MGSEALVSSLIKGELRAFTELTSSGKSGSFFFYSIDGKYVLKTIREDEFAFLRKILKEYHEHVKKHKQTLVPKFLSLNKIAFDHEGLRRGLGMNKVYFVVMNNIFSSKYLVHERYDLKGSTFKRAFFEQGAERPDDKQFRQAMKDLDFLRWQKSVDITSTQQKLMMETLKADCLFFESLGIIDYSLLVGIHFRDRDNKAPNEQSMEDSLCFDDEDEELPDGELEEESTCLQFESPNQKEVYLVGIIDILTCFSSIKKKLEYAIKRVCVGDHISCIPPTPYKDRFLNFIETISHTSASKRSKPDPKSDLDDPKLAAIPRHSEISPSFEPIVVQKPLLKHLKVGVKLPQSVAIQRARAQLIANRRANAYLANV